jgi:Flp pilus assembly protein TadG
MMARQSIRHVRPAARQDGQALVEFALMLPVFLFVVFGVVQLIFILRADGAVQDVARQTARLAATAGGETSSVDASTQQLAAMEGLDPRDLIVQISTTGSDGATQLGSPHAADAVAQVPAQPAAYNAPVSVSLTYTYGVNVPLWGHQTVTLLANATATSAAFGGQAP